MYSLNTISFAVALFGLASATPLAQRSTCTPNFQGKTVSIVNPPTGEWTPTELQPSYYLVTEFGTTNTGEFRVEQDGSTPAGFIIKAANVPANNLAVSALTGSLRLETLNTTDTTQIFQITCQVCGSGDDVNASACSIESTAFDVCVESTGTGSSPFIVSCDSSADAQYWDIIAADQ